MERTLGKGTYKFLVIYEFLGTAMLLYGVNVSPGGDPFGVIFNILAIILVVGPITGAHLNPAVSTGVLISNRNILPQIPIYLLTVFSEIAGAMFGTLMAFSSMQNKYTATLPNHQRGSVPLSELIILKPAPGLTVGNVFMIEMVCTFMLVMIVLVTKTARLSPTKEGLLGALGAVFVLLALTQVGHFSGGCFNPALGIAQTFYQWTQAVNTDSRLTKYVWMYICGPMTGGILAGLAHRGHLLVHRRMNIDDTYRSGSQQVLPDEQIEFDNPFLESKTASPISNAGVNKTISTLSMSEGRLTKLTEKELLQLSSPLIEDE